MSKIVRKFVNGSDMLQVVYTTQRDLKSHEVPVGAAFEETEDGEVIVRPATEAEMAEAEIKFAEEKEMAQKRHEEQQRKNDGIFTVDNPGHVETLQGNKTMKFTKWE